MAGARRFVLVQRHHDALGGISRDDMAKVHTFPLVSDLYSDTRLPLQYLGGGESPAASQVALSTLLTFLEANLAFPSGPVTISSATITGASNSMAIPAGRILSKVVVVSAGHDDFQLGTTDGGSELVEDGQSSTAGEVYVLERYFVSSGTIYFTGMSGNLTVKLVLINLT